MGYCILVQRVEAGSCTPVMVVVERPRVAVEVGWCVLVLMVEVAEVGVVEENKKEKGTWVMVGT